MNEEFWDGVADFFEAEIFDVLHYDRKKLIVNTIQKHGSPGKGAIDFGCGIGNFIPFLAKAFKTVTAVDFSAKCLDRARGDYADLANVEYLKRDLSVSGVDLPPGHFALSVNSLIMPSLAQVNVALDTIASHIVEDGHLLLVVPSLESVMFSGARLIEWNLREGMEPETAVRSRFQAYKEPDFTRIGEGVILADDVPSKHFVREELITLLGARGLEVLEINKIEYPWKTEFVLPPRWMKEPYPWDWFVFARKRA